MGKSHVVGDKAPPASFDNTVEVLRGGKQVLEDRNPIAMSAREEKYVQPFILSM
jgi:hypothetical protein